MEDRLPQNKSCNNNKIAISLCDMKRIQIQGRDFLTSENALIREDLITSIERESPGSFVVTLSTGTCISLSEKDAQDLLTFLSGEAPVATEEPQAQLFNNFFRGWDIPSTPRVKKVFALARKVAGAAGHNYIGTEHILAGLLMEAEGPSIEILKLCGVDTVDLLKRVALVEPEFFAPITNWMNRPQ